MTKFQLIVFMAVVGIISACDNDIDVAPGYPTTIEKKSSIEIDRIVKQIEQSGLSTCMAIDQFGYPIIDIDNDNCIDAENWRFNAGYDEIEQLATEGFYNYGSFADVSDTSLIAITSISTHKGISYNEFKADYPDSLSPVWIASAAPQKHEQFEVRGTNLKILLSPNGVIGISGHWYTDITVPGSDNFDEDGAKNEILDETFEHNRRTITISNDTNWHTAKKVIVPIVRSGQIELHVCWALYPDTWEILVDSQTGEILSSIDISA